MADACGVVGGIIGIVVVCAFIKAIGDAIAGTTKPKSGARTTPSPPGGRVTASLDSLQVRLRSELADDDDSGSRIYSVEGRGQLPIRRHCTLGAVTQVIDTASGKPLLSPLPMLQEPTTLVFMHQVEFGEVSPGAGFADWSGLGLVCPQFLLSPHSGKRHLTVVVRLVDLRQDPQFLMSAATRPSAVLWEHSLQFNWTFAGKGYLEEIADEEAACAVAVKIAVCVAMSDGRLDEAEGRVIKEWMTKSVATASPTRASDFKAKLNGALRDAFAAAKSHGLDLGGLLDELADLNEPGVNHQTLQLAYDVLAADGIADPAELAVTTRIADRLGIDQSDVAEMKDRAIVGVAVESTGDESADRLLGIQAGWSSEQIRKHLRAEFQKWNSRITTLAPGKERDNAQRMLDLIAAARVRHG